MIPFIAANNHQNQPRLCNGVWTGCTKICLLWLRTVLQVGCNIIEEEIYLYDNHDADLCSTFSMWHYLLILCVISSFGLILNQKTECDCSEWISNYLCLIGIRTDPFFSLYKLAYQWRVVVSYSSHTFQYCIFCWFPMRWWMLRILQN